MDLDTEQLLKQAQALTASFQLGDDVHGQDDDVEVDVEGDEDDPALLKELSKLMGPSAAGPAVKSKKKKNSDDDLLGELRMLQQEAGAGADGDDDDLLDEDALEAAVAMEEQGGDAAMDVEKEATDLPDEPEPIENISAKDDKTEEKVNTDEQVVTTASNNNDVETPQSLELPLEVKLTSTSVHSLENFIQGEKIKALNFKRSEQREKALECLRAMKMLQARLEEVKAKVVEKKAASPPPEKVSPPAARKAAPKTVQQQPAPTTKKESAVNQAADPKAASQMYAALARRMDTFINDTFKPLNKVPIVKALTSYYEEQKELLTARQLAGKIPPLFKYEERAIRYEVTNPELASNEVRVRVVKAEGLHVPSSTTSPDAYAVIEWPNPTDSNGAPLTHASSVVKKSESPVFNDASKTFPLPPTSPNSNASQKILARFLEKRKASVELFHSRGFLFKAISLGRATISLSDLATRSTVVTSASLMDPGNPRRKAPNNPDALVMVELCQRQPLNAGVKDIREQVIKFLVLEGSERDFEKIFTGQNSMPESVVVTSPKAAVNNVKSSPVSATASPSADDDPYSVEEDLDLFSIDDFVSNTVMEKEIERMKGVLTSADKKHRSTLTEIFNERTSALTVKMNMLQAMVAMEQLSPQQYLVDVKASLTRDKGRAIAYKKAGKLLHAKMLLWRIKIMTEEIKEMEESL